MCRVEICPWRIDFSRRACAEIRLIGRSTSMRRFGYCTASLTSGLQDRVRAYVVVLHTDDRFPSQLRRVLDRIQLRRRAAVEHDVEPVVVPEALRRPVLV